MRRGNSFLLGVVAPLLALSPATAISAGEPKTKFVLMWQLEAQAPNDEILEIKEGQVVTSARLLPMQLLVVDQDAKTVDGKIVLKSGSELVRAATDGPDMVIACTIGSLAVGPLESFFMNTEKYGCFVDDGKDGSFDRFFTRGGDNVGLLSNKQEVPKKTNSLEPSKYSRSQDLSNKAFPKLIFKYTNYAFISKWIIFQACIDYSDWRCIPLEDTFGLRRNDLPGSFEAYGGRFEVLEKNDNGIRVRMTHPFKAMPMSFSS